MGWLIGCLEMHYHNTIFFPPELINLGAQDLVSILISAEESLRREEFEGGLVLDTIQYSTVSRSLSFGSRGGPATRVVRFFAKHFNCPLTQDWLSDGFSRGRLNALP